MEKAGMRMGSTRGGTAYGQAQYGSDKDLKLFEAFNHFVKIEEELLQLLETRVEQD